MKKLELFKASDFLALDINDREPIEVLFAQSAEIANQILADYLEKNAVRVYAEHYLESWVDTKEQATPDGRIQNPTHQALLINIEPIEKKCEKHEPDYGTRRGDTAYCVHCRVRLEAEWREVK